MASENGHHDVVQSLLGAGAEVNIATSLVSDVTCVHMVHVHVYCGEGGGEAQHEVWVCLCACRAGNNFFTCTVKLPVQC